MRSRARCKYKNTHTAKHTHLGAQRKHGQRDAGAAPQLVAAEEAVVAHNHCGGAHRRVARQRQRRHVRLAHLVCVCVECVLCMLCLRLWELTPTAHVAT